MQTDLLTMLAAPDEAPQCVPDPAPVEERHGPAERLFDAVRTMPGQLALGTDQCEHSDGSRDTEPVDTGTPYIGRCRATGCRRALRVGYLELQQLNATEYQQRAFDPAGGIVVNGVRPLGYCPDHGAYVLKPLHGRYAPDHTCDARCTDATGPQCDCSCCGANHGIAHR